jgi:hypothetical protein
MGFNKFQVNIINPRSGLWKEQYTTAPLHPSVSKDWARVRVRPVAAASVINSQDR